MSTSALSLSEARAELERRVEGLADESHTWGYFPELSPKPDEYPACIRLASELKKTILPNIKETADWRLSFIRLATDEPVSEYGGMHIDVDWGIKPERDANFPKGKEIARLLINLGDKPRVLEYVELGEEEMKHIPRDKYQILKFGKDVEKKKVAIPPISSSSVWYLVFLSSLLPHAGVTNRDGHFLAAFGAYVGSNFLSH